MAPSRKATFTFTEVDELNNPTLTYIYSEPSPDATSFNSEKGKEIAGRVDIAHVSSASVPWSLSSLRSLLIDVFLPAGYPHSVSDDYVSYQIFDSLQAFSSSIAGLLASRAVLQGVGVGNANASPTSALLLQILQDTSGRIATILFAHRVGTALEPECKMYRFAADIFNDLAMVLDCLSPMIPAGVSRVTILSAAGVLRALCGVAGGSSKASLSAHFAKWGNLAEVNAKDSSQETVISLIGMLVGSLVVSHITSLTGTWFILILLLTLHLSLNYAAVRSVQMTTLNRQRANIVFSTLLSSDPDFTNLISNDDYPEQDWKHQREAKEPQIISILPPAQVAKQERIFNASSALNWYYPSTSTQPPEEALGSCQIGVSLRQFLSHSSSSAPLPGSNSLEITLPLGEISSLFNTEDYILLPVITPTNSSTLTNPQIRTQATALLKPSSTPKSHLKAWMHALLAARVLHLSSWGDLKTTGDDDVLLVLSRTLAYLNDGGRFEGYIGALRKGGWDVDGEGGGSALETRVGERVVVSSS
ncbi:vitamin B6 photo-protection and homoeostasis-domain-containing protein [Aspergillus varians]